MLHYISYYICQASAWLHCDWYCGLWYVRRHTPNDNICNRTNPACIDYIPLDILFTLHWPSFSAQTNKRVATTTKLHTLVLLCLLGRILLATKIKGCPAFAGDRRPSTILVACVNCLRCLNTHTFIKTSTFITQRRVKSITCLRCAQRLKSKRYARKNCITHICSNYTRNRSYALSQL